MFPLQELEAWVLINRNLAIYVEKEISSRFFKTFSSMSWNVGWLQPQAADVVPLFSLSFISCLLPLLLPLLLLLLLLHPPPLETSPLSGSCPIWKLHKSLTFPCGHSLRDSPARPEGNLFITFESEIGCFQSDFRSWLRSERIFRSKKRVEVAGKAVAGSRQRRAHGLVRGERREMSRELCPVWGILKSLNSDYLTESNGICAWTSRREKRHEDEPTAWEDLLRQILIIILTTIIINRARFLRWSSLWRFLRSGNLLVGINAVSVGRTCGPKLT